MRALALMVVLCGLLVVLLVWLLFQSGTIR
jgi:hypothetical protein